MSVLSDNLHSAAQQSLENELRGRDGADGISGVCKGTIGGNAVLLVYIYRGAKIALPDSFDGFRVIQRFTGPAERSWGPISGLPIGATANDG